ncbi:glycosyltransferase [Algoriphagus sp. Y33]|uniref:glycosyltransferase n=1 Tax=Algoriphagus sp. Y33 TaxID=2772483 RepID=UPI001786C093|nr:glycosyltransferase [Algoriphagus sp. Y33]
MGQPILFVINSLRLGGAEKICIELANAFVERGIAVDLMVLELREAVLQERLNPKVRLINLEINHARQSFFSIKNILVKSNYGEVLVFTFQLSVVLVLIRKLYGLKFRITARAINNLSEKFRRETSLWHKYVGQFLIRKFYFDVDTIIAQSSGMQKELEDLRGTGRTTIKTIFNFHQLRSLNELFVDGKGVGQEGQCNLLFVGKLKPQKNVGFLLEVAHELKKAGQYFHFTIVGDGPEMKSLLELRGKYALEKEVTFAGMQKNVSQFYAKASVMLLGSWYEGFPNVILEAMEYGIPAVCVNCPSGPEDIIINGENGKLVEGHHVRTFSEEVIQVLHTKWDRDVIRNSLKRFSKDAAVQKYVDLLVKSDC